MRPCPPRCQASRGVVNGPPPVTSLREQVSTFLKSVERYDRETYNLFLELLLGSEPERQMFARLERLMHCILCKNDPEKQMFARLEKLIEDHNELHLGLINLQKAANREQTQT